MLATVAACADIEPGSPDAGVAEPRCDYDPGLELPRFEAPPRGILTEDDVSFRLRDPDADIGAAELELWLTAGDGSLVQRVWTATAPIPTRATDLAAGDFEPGFDGLEPWTHYAVRARFVAREGCSYGAWMEAPPFRSDDGSEYLFSDQIHSVRIDIEEPSLSLVAAQSEAPWCEPYQRDYHAATVTFEGQSFPGAGVRAKGGAGSAREFYEKAGLKAHLSWDDPAIEECAAERRLHGLQRLTLNNMVQDPSYVRETLGYRFYRQLGVPAPRTAHMNVEVNGEPWGLYLHVESFDRRFLSRRFESSRGMLYEGECGCDLLPEDVPADGATEFCFERKFHDDACADIEEGDDPRSFSLLLGLTEDLAALEDFYPAAGDHIDFDAFLSLWAADAILNNWDGYLYRVQHNYRIYHDPSTDLWSLIPSGIDQTLSYTTNKDSERRVSSFEPTAVLATRCLEDSECEAAFAQRLHEAVDLFESMGLDDAATEIEQRVTPHVEVDPRREVTVDEFHARVDAVRSFVQTRPAEIRAELAARGY